MLFSSVHFGSQSVIVYLYTLYPFPSCLYALYPFPSLFHWLITITPGTTWGLFILHSALHLSFFQLYVSLFFLLYSQSLRNSTSPITLWMPERRSHLSGRKLLLPRREEKRMKGDNYVIPSERDERSSRSSETYSSTSSSFSSSMSPVSSLSPASSFSTPQSKKSTSKKSVKKRRKSFHATEKKSSKRFKKNDQKVDRDMVKNIQYDLGTHQPMKLDAQARLTLRENKVRFMIFPFFFHLLTIVAYRGFPFLSTLTCEI